MSSSIPKPFKIAISRAKIDTLKQKLGLAEFPDELEGAGWDLGCPLSDIKRLANVWQTWDWREAEKKLNQAPMYTMGIPVDGFGSLDIHFVHQPSKADGAIPLLFVHGWPGSFIESLKLLPLLSDDQQSPSSPAFHVVAPSLPNFGFSQGVSKRGFAITQYAETCHKLMLQLGYREYVTQGGDWGFYITRGIGALYPESCKASHINMMRAKPPADRGNPETYTEEEKKGLKRMEWFEKEGRGYSLLQQTKPQTVAYALHDSPVALLSWIYEKLHDWTDVYPWTDDEILTWISIYAFSRAGPGAAHRIYYETLHTRPHEDGKRVLTRDDAMVYIGEVKLGLAFNPMEITNMPKSWCRTLGDVVFESDNDHGGHFYAHEHPEWLARDLQNMFGKEGGAYGVVEAKVG